MRKVSLYDFVDEAKAYTPAAALPTSLLLDSSGQVRTYFAPFEYINTRARVVLCGITPGFQQASIALETAGRALREGKSIESAQASAKATASFAGAMRSNLSAMLDHVGVHRKLGIQSATDLFGARADLVHYTSALRNPVFVDGKNYSGAPSMLGQPSLRWQIDNYLSEEVVALKDALWIPLGPKVSEVLAHLVRNGIINEARVLDGLPHPSGANAERISVFLDRKDPADVSVKTNANTILRGRESVLRKVAALG